MKTSLAPLFFVCGPLLLASCSGKQPPLPPLPDPVPPVDTTPADNPYAGGKQYPWTNRLELAVADPYAAGRSYPWVSPTAASSLKAQGPADGQNFLSGVQWTSATNTWGPVELDHSNGEQNADDGSALSVGGSTFAKGLGVHAASEIHYALGGQCNTFTARVGVDDEVGARGSVQFRAFGDGRMLFNSGVRRGGDPALPVNLSVAGIRELRLVTGDGGDGIEYDHADWGDAALSCKVALPGKDVWLSDLAYVSAQSGWGPVEFDRSNGEQGLRDGGALTIAGRTFDRGMGVHAPSALDYDLGRTCTAFSAQLGLDGEVGKRGSVVFEVYGDGQKLYDSGPLRGGDPARQAVVDLRGVQTLRLSATDGGDGLAYDHADWADARLQCGTAVTGQPGTLDPGFGEAGRSSVGGVATVTENGGTLVVLGGHFGLTRLSPSGVVLARGAATPNGAATLNGAASALALQPDGALIAVGYLDGQMVALRYRPDLTLDPGFGVGGVVRLRLGVAASQYDSDPVRSAATAVTVAPDGQIVLAGYASRPFSPAPGVTLSDDDFALVRLGSDGRPDLTFGKSGVVTTPLNALLAGGDASTDKLYGVALQPDGKIVVAGEAQYDANNYSSVVARYLGTGKLDPSFSGDGIALGGLGERSTFHAVAVEKGGAILLGGGTGRFFTSALLQRFSPVGEAGEGVRFQFRVPENAQLFQTVVTALRPQSDGRVVLGGYAGDTTFVSRFGADLTQDLTFGATSGGAVSGGNVPVGSGSLIALTQDAERRIIATTAQFTATGIEGDGTVRLFP
ncbi:NPCBM/NEW2 domain-containing protein [Deinococcus marmoris]|uniref:Alpha-galactosidase n=1 Tax=Deinococcus marmoris TaxID=249408 RepID=A0A1U7NVU7_9DEIO|nr:NPCBM/NEW2 domain-containing protein [Deinococcus marmoris]OLV17045.1 alpha-galactosidase [Deinococcus marmoris]